MPDAPDIHVQFACNDNFGNGQGWAGMASLEVDGDRVCTLEHHFRNLAISNHPETGAEPPIEVLTNVVINDMHGKAYMLLAGEHFGLAAWGNMVGNVSWRAALLAHPDQLGLSPRVRRHHCDTLSGRAIDRQGRGRPVWKNAIATGLVARRMPGPPPHEPTEGRYRGWVSTVRRRSFTCWSTSSTSIGTSSAMGTTSRMRRALRLYVK